MGESNVGKTCLNLRYTEDIFNGVSLNTLAVDCRIKYLDILDKKVKLIIYDTAG